MKNKDSLNKIYIYSLLIFIIDFISKFLIQSNFKLLDTITIINNFFYITYTKNLGGAWSILEGHNIFLILVSLIFIAFFIYYIIKEEKFNKLLIISYSLIIGGVFGNLFDRIFRGHVIDFLSFNIFGYYFPIFNMADTFIIFGFCALIINEIRRNL